MLTLAHETVDHFWSSWQFVVDALTAVQTAASRLSVRDCALSMRDHAWLVLAVLLRPFGRTPGFIERRCLARAVRIGPPRFKVEVKAVETCTVNNGNNLLRGTLWLPSGRDAVGPFPAVVIRSPYGAQDQNADSEGAVAKAFGVPAVMGMAKRQSFIVVDGKIAVVIESAKTGDHAAEVQAALAKLGLGKES